jgi:hypothetical protein
MNLASTAIFALEMSNEAFAAVVGKGTSFQKPRWSEALRTGGIFGVVEAPTPRLDRPSDSLPPASSRTGITGSRSCFWPS